ncbi:hypothetical protein ABL78_3405 [Leptomonas seymouri]|uniref:Uncharacterized protein n=1 Tax=Leptomonas seymouri TaxID=5684 RepID=A0A0N1HXY7_LEPSE|nr:hypothetical protein ABL78_3405 [Leptomonas seymouri]|eukprot:KPI87494.1 hypothetical protein ABL78_3405 [Leptomonas seymouri]
MEGRGSNTELSAARPGRRHSSVTIIAPGEEVNVFQPSAVSTSSQMLSIPVASRFDNFKANPREYDIVGAAPTPASREAPLPPPAQPSAAAIAPLASRPLPGKVASHAGTAGLGAHRKAAEKPRLELPPGDGKSGVPNSAAKRRQSLHIFPQTPPTAVIPTQRPLSSQYGNVLGVAAARVAPLPPNPSLHSSGVGPAVRAADTSAVRPAVRGTATTPTSAGGGAPRKGGVSPQAAPNSTMRNVSSAKIPTTTERRGPAFSANQQSLSPGAPAFFDAPLVHNGSTGVFVNHGVNIGNGGGPHVSAHRGSSAHLALPRPSSATKWPPAARQQLLTTTSRNGESPDNFDAFASTLNFGRRATVPQVASSQWRAEQMRLPHPLSHYTPTSAAGNGTDSEDGTPVPEPELPSLLLSGEASPTSGRWRSGNRSTFVDRLTDADREAPAITAGRATDTHRAVSASSATQPPLQRDVRAESPPPNNSEFLKPTQRKNQAEGEGLPVSLRKKMHRQQGGTGVRKDGSNSHKIESESDEGNDDSISNLQSGASRAKSEWADPEDDSTLLRGTPQGESEPPLKSGIFSSIQSLLRFSPKENPTKTLELNPRLKKRSGHARVVTATAAGSNTLGRERSVGSLDDFDLTNNDTLEATSSLNGVVSRPQSSTHTAVRPPSPVYLSSTLLDGDEEYPMTSSPPLDTAKRHDVPRQNTGSSTSKVHRSNDDSDRLERSASISDAGKGGSLDRWNFDFLAKKETNGHAEIREVVEMLSNFDTSAETVAPAAQSPMSPKRKDKDSGDHKGVEERWFVTQSLSINQADYSFDRLPLHQQGSSVARLRKVFESDRKPKTKDEGEDRAKSSRSKSPLLPAKLRGKRGSESPSVAEENMLSGSTCSTIVVPRSAPSLMVEGRERGHSGAARTTNRAPVVEFSYERIALPMSPQRVPKAFPLVSGHPNSHSSMKPKSAPLNTSAGEFFFNLATSTDDVTLINGHSTSWAKTEAKNKITTLPRISLTESDGCFSLARFQDSSASVDTVNMFDRCDS